MANEIKNLSHAAISATFAADPATPILLAGWGVVAASLQREAALGDGAYSVQLTQPLAGRTTSVPGQFLTQEGIVVSQSVALPNFVDVVLAPADFLPPPADTDVQLTHLLIVIRDAAGDNIDGAAFLSAHVLRTPQD